ncbi:MAG: DUF1629 domain-containing protein [Hyphomonas sp.]|uniref:imm11 family protein n=1 Tax=Hyphomonas sp. TaxID=87 RepID=UPI00329978E8
MNFDTFGKYRPAGAFEGKSIFEADEWGDRLKAHFLVKMTPEERAPFEKKGGDWYNWSIRYKNFAEAKFKREPGLKLNPYTPPLTPIEPHEVPRCFVTEKGYSNLGRIVSLGGYFSVTAQVKEMIERLEPHVHQFYELPINIPRGKTYKENYFLVVIGTFLNSFIPTQEQHESTKNDWLGEISGSYIMYKPQIRSFKLERSKHEGHHLWRERLLQSNLVCVSDELYEEISAAGLDIPKHAKMVEVADLTGDNDDCANMREFG